MILDTGLAVFTLAALIVIAVALNRIRHLFAAAMLMGFFSLLSSAYYLVDDAVDVAITEAAVGAGLSTVLMIGAISLTTRYEKPGTSNGLLAAVIATATVVLLLYGTADLPAYGAPDAPIHQPGTPAYHYLHESAAEIGIPNVVTSVLASYRGFDTLGETTVVFTAGLAVFILLGHYRRTEHGDEG